MSENFEIILNYIKDLSVETPDAETIIYVKDNISKYQMNIDITSNPLKNKMIEVNTKLTFSDNSDSKKTQVVLAQRGLLGKKNDNIFLILYSGKILNIDSKKTSIVNFEKTEFNLSRFSTKTILFPKIQEQKTTNLLQCLNSYYKYKVNYYKY